MAVMKIKKNGKWVIVGAGAKGDAGITPQKGIDYSDGEDGYTPVKGTDYWTATDKAEMVNDVLAALPAAEGVSF